MEKRALIKNEQETLNQTLSIHIFLPNDSIQVDRIKQTWSGGRWDILKVEFRL
jgi:hypothetical protein